MTGLAAALAEHGMIIRGGFVFAEDETTPPAAAGEPARSVVLIGHGGGSIWPYFSAWLAEQGEPSPDPLDRWSRHVLDPIAGRFGARAVYPFEKPWLPFQQWAARAEGLKSSPLGILMHPDFGLWHAYRGALLFEHEIELPLSANPIHLCDTCTGKPCMNSCPVGAVSVEGMDIGRCHEWLRSKAAWACRTAGCLARSACPHDRFRYSPEQTAFHMAAHLRGL
ncbi:MAG: hypothetical protein CL535_08245 [Ahrensia sp.]|nr:hypothetical protein [Ahrensia sp.]|tara:strand:+ start:1127 stop:1795 length:669 start_codon:yes stop_codon:yes gene_type:complete